MLAVCVWMTESRLSKISAWLSSWREASLVSSEVRMGVVKAVEARARRAKKMDFILKRAWGTWFEIREFGGKELAAWLSSCWAGWELC